MKRERDAYAEQLHYHQSGTGVSELLQEPRQQRGEKAAGELHTQRGRILLEQSTERGEGFVDETHLTHPVGDQQHQISQTGEEVASIGRLCLHQPEELENIGAVLGVGEVGGGDGVQEGGGQSRIGVGKRVVAGRVLEEEAENVENDGVGL